jgi:hypothetical protein
LLIGAILLSVSTIYFIISLHSRQEKPETAAVFVTAAKAEKAKKRP